MVHVHDVGVYELRSVKVMGAPAHAVVTIDSKQATGATPPGSFKSDFQSP